MTTATERFTPSAMTILHLALREALMLGHSRINTQHLLLALLREDQDTAAAHALRELGVDQKALMEIWYPDAEAP